MDGASQTENPDEPATDQEQTMGGGQEGEPQPETEDLPETQDEPNTDQDLDNEELPSHTYKEHKFVFKDFERVCYCELQSVFELTESVLAIANVDYFSFFWIR